MNPEEMNSSFVKQMNSKHNHLLLKDQIGRAKISPNRLPPRNFIYGKKIAFDAEGVSKLCTSWCFHQQSLRKKAEVNFVKLNTLGISQGSISAKDLAQFRKDNGYRCKPRYSRRSRSKAMSSERVYGSAHKPPTPISSVLGNQYGNKAAMDNDSFYTRQALLRQLLKQKETKPACQADRRPTNTNHTQRSLYKMKK